MRNTGNYDKHSDSISLTLFKETLFKHCSRLLKVVLPDNFGLAVPQTITHFLKRIECHVWTTIAGTGFPRGRHDPGDWKKPVLGR